MQIKHGAPPPPQTMAHKPRIVMPKRRKYKEKLSIHLLHGHVGIIAGGLLAATPNGVNMDWGVTIPRRCRGLLAESPNGLFGVGGGR